MLPGINGIVLNREEMGTGAPRIDGRAGENEPAWNRARQAIAGRDLGGENPPAAPRGTWRQAFHTRASLSLARSQRKRTPGAGSYSVVNDGRRDGVAPYLRIHGLLVYFLA